MQLEALNRFVRTTEPYLPPETLERPRRLLERATRRLALSGTHTVVALAGATGGGKSSLFNALARAELSPVGVRRPTTGQAYACVWGRPGEAADLLDWLEIPTGNRFTPDPDGADQDRLRGLVLLDLPDCDAVERDHSAEVDRLLGMVDVMVWVVDPQKYADKVVHERHLSRFRRHADVTVVTLNQADLLRAGDLERLLADLRRLLAADGLDGVLTIATSAVDAPAGLAQLRARIREIVVGGRAAVQRLAADLDMVVDDLAGLVGPPPAEDLVNRTATLELTDRLARVAGVTAFTDVVEASYRRRAAAVTGWPPVRWLRRLGAGPRGGGGPSAVTGPAPAQEGPDRPVPDGVAMRASVSLVVRAVAGHAGAGLPAPWPEVVTTAARSRLDELTGAMDRTITAAASGPDGTPLSWRLIAAAHWLALGVALVGAGWLAVAGLMSWISGPAGGPAAGPAPALLLAGLLAGPLLSLLARSLAGSAARRARMEAVRQLRVALAGVGRAQVIEPIGTVLDAYRKAQDALRAARGAGW
jgi:hypothetical protein